MLNLEKLHGKLNPKIIKTREAGGGIKLSYLPGYVIEGILNELSGYLWSRRTLDLNKIYEREYQRTNKDGSVGKMLEIGYSSRVEIEIPTNDGLIIKQGCGFGNGQSSLNNPSAAWELAIKEAETDAFKRAAKSLGEQFGLELYDKDLDIVRSYELGKKRDDKFNEAWDAILQSNNEEDAKKIFKTYDGNYKSDLRESLISHIQNLRQSNKAQ